ncbi:MULTISPECIES: type II toxin-antitoxin system RelE/ParE family toxin [Vagococcus]|uniref:Phage-related protein n=1 Tax=Vagococcus fluvialis bH819 TaxID=1255619 RepID=A0A1X6WRY5_9ENTE|nr:MULTISPECIES: type II toxin-antitoxin system RelE/ParE family toxin [Vagococcus]SLM87113.1 Phage-related protein [Vagococcus fluvialis bH819]HCM90606.1 type II toxin-antitoxin system RelE/ParE family toxin [Vagococcus sp.]
MYELTFYETKKGVVPVDEFIETLKESKVNRLLLIFDELEKKGARKGRPVVGHIEGKMYEIVLDRHRIFFYVKGNELILLHSFLKQTQKTPKAEIKKAFREIDDWLNRGG